MRMGIGVSLCVAAAAVLAYCEDEECRDAPETAKNDAVTSLGPAMEIRLKGATRDEQVAEIRSLYKEKCPNLDVESGGFTVFAEALLGTNGAKVVPTGLVGRKQGRYAVYLPVEKAIRACRAPKEFKNELGRFWAWQYVAMEMISGDTVEAVKTIEAIPAGWECVKVGSDAELCAEVARRCPGLERMDPPARKRVLDWIAAFNPAIRAAGYRMVTSGKLDEDWLHTVVTLDGGRQQVCLYQFLPAGPVLLPAGDAGLAALPSIPPDEAYDCALPLVDKAPSFSRRVAVRFLASPKPRLCNLMELTMYCGDGDAPIEQAFFTTPLLSNVPRPVAPEGLRIQGDRLSGEATIEGWKFNIDLTVATATAGSPCRTVTGWFSATVPESPGTCTGAVNGLCMRGADLDGPAGSLPAIGKALESAGLSPVSTTPMEREFGRPLGPSGSGAASDTGAEIVESLAGARLCWRSEQTVPGSYAATPQGGYASPLVFGGNVYQMFYDLPTDDMFGDSYLNPWLDNLRKNDPAKVPLFEDALRRKCSVSAHDVVVCLDGQTGRTRWKSSFMRKGANYSFQARGTGFVSTKTGPVGTPSVVDGRVYYRGSSGRVYCLDAADGSVQWESTIGWRHDQIEMLKRACRRMKTPYGSGYDLLSSPGVSDGVVVLSGHIDRGTVCRRPAHIMGLDARTGKELWRIENMDGWANTPMIWRHSGREYVVVGARGSTCCIEPKTGKVLWTIPGMSMDHKTPIDGDHIILATGKERVGCYRMSPSGATRLWDIGFPGANARGLILKGMVFIPASPEAVCLSLETGAVLGKQPGQWLHVLPSGVGDRAICDVSNNGGAMRMYRLGRDGKFAHLGDHGIPVTCCTTPAIADGRLVVRGRNEVLCYDIRANPEAARRNAVALCALLGSGDQAIDDRAARGLAGLGEPGAVAFAETLSRLVAADDRAAVGTMGRTAGAMPPLFRDKATPVLLGALKKDKQPLVAAAAAIALGTWGSGGARAVPALREAMQLTHPMVERACREAIRAIEVANQPPKAPAVSGEGTPAQAAGTEAPPEPAAVHPDPLELKVE